MNIKVTSTSTHFVSTSASGENWRDISKNVLEQLEALKTDGFKPNIGFLYLTDALADDAVSILTLFKSVTGVDHWSGCVALGVCGGGVEYVDVPAISVMIGFVPAECFREFALPAGTSFKKLHNDLEPWLNKNDPMLVFLHADPSEGSHPAAAIEEVEALVGGFMVGGLCSSRKEHVIVSHEIIKSGISGFVFNADVPVATCLSQGCIPMGGLHEISRDGDHVIAYLDGRTPFEVFAEDMKSMAEEKLGFKTEDILTKGTMNAFPDEVTTLLQGEAHVAFPVAGTDQNDFLVRNIMAMDPDTGVIAVAESLEDGQKMMFVHRDDETVRADLSSALVSLRRRIINDHGAFSPKAALYVSCVARAGVSFSGNEKAGGEMALLREVLGDIPITGFYAGGEISNNRLYGYTGVLTLFL